MALEFDHLAPGGTGISENRVSAAHWSPPGRSAIAIVRVVGDVSRLGAAATQLFQSAGNADWTQLAIGAVSYGQWGRGPTEGVVVTRLGPHQFEISCHGGTAAVEQVLTSLQAAGAIIETWREQLGRTASFLHAECTERLARAATVKSAKLILEHSLQKLPEFAAGLSWEADPGLRDHLAKKIELSLKWAEVGRRLVEGWTLSIVGIPNVGKSSLANRLLGYDRSIVVDQPGTTRDVVRASTAVGGWLLQMADTAGVRVSKDPLETAGIERSIVSAEGADVVLHVVDASQPLNAGDVNLAGQFSEAIIVLNKCDLPMNREVLNHWPDALPISTITSQGLAPLLEVISRKIMRRSPAPDVIIPVTPRQVGLLKGLLDSLHTDDIARFRSLQHELCHGPGSQ
jgi:tRNA modification GTPase